MTQIAVTSEPGSTYQISHHVCSIQGHNLIYLSNWKDWSQVVCTRCGMDINEIRGNKS